MRVNKTLSICFILFIILPCSVYPEGGNHGTEEDIIKAFTYYTEGKLSEAEFLYKKILSKDSDNFQAHFSLGIIYQAKKNHTAAIGHFERCISLAPDFAPSYNNLGWTYFTKGDYDKAQFLFMIAVNKDPSYVLAYTNLGTVYLALGQSDMAEFIFRRILEVQPDNIIALNNLGLIYNFKGNLEDARIVFQKVLDMDPGASAARINLARIYQRQGLWGKAKNELEQVLKSHPESDASYFAFASMYYEMGDMEKAERYAEKTLQYRQGHFGALSIMADISLKKEDYASAVQLLNELKEQSPANPGVYEKLGVAYRGLNDLEKSRENLEKTLTIEPNNYRIWNRLGEVLEAAGRKNEAYNAYFQSVFIESDYADGLLNLIRMQIMEAKYDQADINLKKLLIGQPWNKEAILLHICLLWNQGKRDKAMDELADFLKRDPRNEKAERIKATFLLQIKNEPEGFKYRGNSDFKK